MSGVALVTGCFGFIGSHLVERLLDDGYHVLGIGRLRNEKKQNAEAFINSADFKMIGEDVSTIDTCDEHEIDVLFHLATSRNKEDPVQLTRINVQGTLNMLELTRKNGCKHFVFSSSAAVYGNTTDTPITENTPLRPVNIYGASKAAAEQYIKAYNEIYGIGACILRYSNVYGPRQSPKLGAISIFVNRILRNDPVSLEGDGSYQYTPIFVTDAVEATYLASLRADAVGAIINVCGSEVLNLLDIVKEIQKYIPDSTSDIEYKDPRPNWSKTQIVSISTMKDKLLFTPKHAFKKALPATIEWYSNR